MLEERGIKPALRTIAQDRLMHSCGKSSQKFWGLLTRKERWACPGEVGCFGTAAGLIAVYFGF